MNWWAKFLTLLILNFWLYPYAIILWAAIAAVLHWWHPTIAVLGWHIAIGPSTWVGVVIWWGILVLPTLWLLAGIMVGGKRLPGWCWQFDTPDATLGSPYSQQEAQAAPYYTFTALGPFVQRIIGDYRWFAMRNLWYGIAFKWGLRPDSSWTFQFTGNPYTADTDPNTRKYVLGRLVIRAFKDGRQVGWARRGTITVSSRKFVKYWWGWKLSEYVQPGTKPVPPAMIAMQIELRSLDTVGGV
jgi:hypothetical protein